MKKNNMRFKNEILFVDGSYRDIVIESTDNKDWDKAILFIEECYLSELYVDGEFYNKRYYSFNEISKMKEDRTVILKILVGECQLNCHFFNENELEIDFDPNEIYTDDSINKLLDFMELLSFIVEKDVLITPENMHHQVLYSINNDKIIQMAKEYKKKYLLCKNKKSLKKEYGILFIECLNKIDGKVMPYFNSKRIINNFERRDIEDATITEVSTKDEILNVLGSHFEEEGYIIWDNAELPVIKVKLNKISEHIDDICAVAFHTWLVFNNGENIVKIRNLNSI